jgi:hypothetical protein
MDGIIDEYFVSAISGALILSVTLPGDESTGTYVRAGDWISERHAGVLASSPDVRVTVVPHVAP